MQSFYTSALLIMIVLCQSGCGGGGSKSRTPTPPAPSTTFDVNQARQTGSQWRLVWADEFSGTELDLSRWQYEVNCAGGGNNELQCYQGGTHNTEVSDGQLTIIARNESVTGDSGWTGNSGNTVQRNYSSARLNSRQKGDWKYGRVEVRAKLPKGKGIWPAIWMLPTDSAYGDWPLSGEIDIMEAINLGVAGATPNRLYGTVHYGNKAPGNRSSQILKDPAFDPAADFHTYAIEWQKGEIRWYIDNDWYGSIDENTWFTAGSAANSTTASPFDQPFHLLLNLAVGGNWPGSPDNTTVFPQRYAIDFVRVYECSAKNAEGWGCATLTGKEPVYAPL